MPLYRVTNYFIFVFNILNSFLEFLFSLNKLDCKFHQSKILKVKIATQFSTPSQLSTPKHLSLQVDSQTEVIPQIKAHSQTQVEQVKSGFEGKKSILKSSAGFTPPPSSTSFASGVSGDLQKIDGEVYEHAAINLFTQEGWTRSALYKLFKTKLDLNNPKSDKNKEVNLIFIPKIVCNLSALKTRGYGTKIILLGSLGKDLEVLSPEQVGNEDAFIIPHEAIVFVEIKSSSEKIGDAIQQQNHNLRIFIDWIKNGMIEALFKKRNDKTDSELRDFLKQRQEVEVYLIIITNGDASQLPTKEGLKKALTYQYNSEDRSTLLKIIFEEGANEPSIVLRSHKIKVKVLFLYVPNFVTTQFYQETFTKLTNKKEAEMKAVVEEKQRQHEESINKLQEKFAQDRQKYEEELTERLQLQEKFAQDRQKHEEELTERLQLQEKFAQDRQKHEEELTERLQLQEKFAQDRQKHEEELTERLQLQEKFAQDRQKHEEELTERLQLQEKFAQDRQKHEEELTERLQLQEQLMQKFQDQFDQLKNQYQLDQNTLKQLKDADDKRKEKKRNKKKQKKDKEGGNKEDMPKEK